MSRTDVLERLAALQARFGAMLRTPLDRSTGTLRARMESYPDDLLQDALPGPALSQRERLAVYNRQYWFRLFGVLQQEYLLTARLTGMWRFNQLASDYLCAHPPHDRDVQRITPGFLPFLETRWRHEREYAHVPTRALLEAARIDDAYSCVFLAPATRALDPSALRPEALASARLVQNAQVAFLRETWPLLALRRTAQREPGDRLQLPRALERAQHWAIVRKGHGHAFVPLAARAYRLYELLCEHDVGSALATLEAECSEKERAELPAVVQKALHEGVRAGFWMAQP